MWTETITGPLWVYLYDGEIPNGAAYVGGTIIITAVVGHSFATMKGGKASKQQQDKNIKNGAAAATTETAP